MRRPGLHTVDAGLIFVVMMWGFSPVIFKIALAELNPLAFIFMRFLTLSLIAVCVLAWQRRHDDRAFHIAREDIVFFVISGLSGYGVYQILYMEGLAHTTVFASVLLNATVPLWSALILAALRIERIHRLQWVGLATSLAGVAWFLLAAQSHQSELAADRALTAPIILLGNLLTIFSSLLFAAYGVTNKRLMRRYSPATMMCYTLLIGTAALAPFGIPALAHQDWSRVTWHAWIIIPYSAVVPIYVAYTIWNWSIREKGVGYVTLYSYAVPITGGIIGWVLVHEPLTPIQMAAGVLVLGGMLAARRGALRVSDAHAQPRHSALADPPSHDTAGPAMTDSAARAGWAAIDPASGAENPSGSSLRSRQSHAPPNSLSGGAPAGGSGM